MIANRSFPENRLRGTRSRAVRWGKVSFAEFAELGEAHDAAPLLEILDHAEGGMMGHVHLSAASSE